MEAVMRGSASGYNRLVTWMDQKLGSRRTVVAIAGLFILAAMMMMQAHAGTGGTSFTAVATKLEGWAQGGLGLTIVAGALIFGVTTMLFTGRGTILAIVVGGAVALYYGIPVVEKIFSATAGFVGSAAIALGHPEVGALVHGTLIVK